MIFINDILIKDCRLDHINNFNIIKNETSNLLSNQFKNCVTLIQRIIVTDNINRINETYNYNINNRIKGTVHKSSNSFDIIFNYNKLAFVEDGRYYLDLITKNVIYHELCHLLDKIKYGDLIDKKALELKLNNFEKFLGEQIFCEFNAQYNATLYEPLEWDFNDYWLDSNTEKYHKTYYDLIKRIDELDNKNNELESEIECLIEDIKQFTVSIMYDLSISFGSLAADNKIKIGRKIINKNIKGINNEIDNLLNNFFDGLNNVINDNKLILEYSFKNGSVVLQWMSNILLKKGDILDSER